MKKCNSLAIAVVACLSSSTVLANQSPWSLGVGAIYSPKVYKGTPTNRTIIPMLGYEGEHFFVRGLTAGYRLNPRRSTHNIVFRAIYDPRSYEPSDSSIADMKLLDEREYTVLGGVSYQYMSLIGLLEASIGADILGVHNGAYGEVAWRFPVRFPGGAVTPAIGYSYNDSKLNQHLYGVSEQESVRTGGNINAFDVGASGQYFIGVSGYYSITDNILVNGAVRFTNLEGEIENSPILDSTISRTAMLGISYRF